MKPSRELQAFQDRLGHGFADPELLPLLHVEGQDESAAVAVDLGRGRQNPEIDIAARAVEIDQKLTVKGDPLGHESVALDDGAQKACLFRVDHAAQAAIGIGAVADKADALVFDHPAFADLEDEIDPVVGSGAIPARTAFVANFISISLAFLIEAIYSFTTNSNFNLFRR